MSTIDRTRMLEELGETFAKPGGKQALRFALNVLSAIPIVGGGIAGAGSFWAESEQNASNNKLLDWALLADLELTELSDSIKHLLSEPSHVSMALLLGEIFGDQVASHLLANENTAIPVVMNPSTVAELEPYVSKQWLLLSSTGAICSMGAGNRVGNHIEELKRPYGLGSGFLISVTTQGCSEE